MEFAGKSLMTQSELLIEDNLSSSEEEVEEEDQKKYVASSPQTREQPCVNYTREKAKRGGKRNAYREFMEAVG